MKTAILYYSFGGFTKKYAEKAAGESGADLFEIHELRKRNIISAFIPGCPYAMKQKRVRIKPIDCDFSAYDSFILAAPVWAGFPAPAFNSALALLPKGAKVEVVLTSGSGDSSKGRTKVEELVKSCGCELTGYKDITNG